MDNKDQSKVDINSNQADQGAGSKSGGNDSHDSLDLSTSDVKAQLEKLAKKAKELEADNFKYREEKRKAEEAAKAREVKKLEKKGKTQKVIGHYKDEALARKIEKEQLEAEHKEIVASLEASLNNKLSALTPDEKKRAEAVFSKAGLTKAHQKLAILEDLIPNSSVSASRFGQPASLAGQNQMDIVREIVANGDPKQIKKAANRIDDLFSMALRK